MIFIRDSGQASKQMQWFYFCRAKHTVDVPSFQSHVNVCPTCGREMFGPISREAANACLQQTRQVEQHVYSFTDFMDIAKGSKEPKSKDLNEVKAEPYPSFDGDSIEELINCGIARTEWKLKRSRVFERWLWCKAQKEILEKLKLAWDRTGSDDNDDWKVDM